MNTDMNAILPLFLFLPLLAQGQKGPEIPRLSGIVDLPEFKRAIFEFKEDCCSPRQLVLSEGESMWGLELVSISPTQRSVQVKIEGAAGPMALNLPSRTTSKAVPSPGIELVNASVYSALELYGQFSGKTLLYSPRLPAAGVSVQGPVASRKDAAKMLQTALSDIQISSVTDGDKFMLIVPSDQAGGVKPHAPRTEPSPKTTAELVQPGMIAFHGVPMEQAYFIYADLIGAKLDRGGTRPAPIQPFIFLYTQSVLSQEEAVYAFDTIFGWQGIKMVRGQDGLVRPMQQSAK